MRNPPADGSSSHDSSVTCPFCGFNDVHLERERGPALCRTVYYCDSCEQPFEEFS